MRAFFTNAPEEIGRNLSKFPKSSLWGGFALLGIAAASLLEKLLWGTSLHNGMIAWYDGGSSDGGIYYATQEPIPEPSTIILMSCGLLGLLGIVIKQRRKEK